MFGREEKQVTGCIQNYRMCVCVCVCVCMRMCVFRSRGSERKERE